jgi:ubiquinone biosynthesis protein
MMRSFLKLCDTQEEMIEPNALERELLEILDNYYAVPIKDMNVGHLLLSLTDLLRIHHLRLPKDLVVMIKALVTAEGSARLLCPDLDIISEIRDYIHRLARRRYRPDVLWRSIRNTLAGLWFSQSRIPYQIGRVISKLEQGKLGFTLRLEKLEQLISALEHASNRLTAGIITGAIIIGSSMIITTGVGPYLFGFPALGVIGYLLSVVLGMYLLYTILRHK